MTTKKVILDKAIELFNKNGYATVSMRDIADAANKSVGNITYHYKKKSDLIFAIVELQYEDLQSLDLQTEVDIEGLNEQLKMMLDFQKKYYFYFGNMIELRKTYHEILEFQLKIREELTLHFIRIIENFEKKEIFRASPNKELHACLAKGIVLLMMSWIQQTSLGETEQHEELLNIVWGILYFNLTEKGIGFYNQIFNKNLH
ncbi:transcriptional regulator, TetR family [Paenibacillus sophorae]|uniref:TetR/AcrR family transcriptional regulator n=1 Tax=Paenibacillus sophorae TaxID=1333845 RepID=A0A1H8TSV7_9BACL|nr:TetR/AcrR family transcriptional regulator [Paenibacillus sophorae]QWU18018.1 TetR/AcrR family transcriptional regulator [Paenibacillus sophorae]SEO94100.1 transcriptional regulator, TetR family [Paenibacillus sophorae]